MNKSQILHLIGAASGIAAQDQGCADGPAALQAFEIEEKLRGNGLQAQWKTMLFTLPDLTGSEVLPEVAKWCGEIAEQTLLLTRAHETFVTLGGDHTCAVGTWSGVAAAMGDEPIGLIWLDAHMDAHTFETSESGAIHGMPLASLLGEGDEALSEVLTSRKKLLPEHLCLIGVRSFESGEAELLKRQGVKIFTMEDVDQQGLDSILKQAIEITTKGTAGFGISIDLDGIDPEDAPGVGSPEKNGIQAAPLIKSLELLSGHKNLLGLEIAEYNPHHDENHKTAQIVLDLICAIYGEKK